MWQRNIFIEIYTEINLGNEIQFICNWCSFLPGPIRLDLFMVTMQLGVTSATYMDGRSYLFTKDWFAFRYKTGFITMCLNICQNVRVTVTGTLCLSSGSKKLTFMLLGLDFFLETVYYLKTAKCFVGSVLKKRKKTACTDKRATECPPFISSHIQKIKII